MRKNCLIKEQQQKLNGAVGDSATLLYQYYILRSSTDNFTYDDGTAAAYLGWDISKVKRLRLKLKHAFWYHQESGVMSSGRKTLITYLGREKVIAALGIENILGGHRHTYEEAEALLDDSGVHRYGHKVKVETRERKEEQRQEQLDDWVESGLIEQKTSPENQVVIDELKK